MDGYSIPLLHSRPGSIHARMGGGGAASSHLSGYESDHEWILDGRVFGPLMKICALDSYCLLFAEADTEIGVVPYGAHGQYDLVRVLNGDPSDRDLVRALQDSDSGPSTSALEFTSCGERYYLFPTVLTHRDFGCDRFEGEVDSLVLESGDYALQTSSIESDHFSLLAHRIRKR